jgi:hypothetical protein
MDETVKIVGHYSLADQTNVNPIGLAALLILGVCVLVLPRSRACIPILILACMISLGQRFYIAGLNWDFLRLIIVFGYLRVVMKHEVRGFQWQSLDTMIILWALCSASAVILREGSGAVVNQMGVTFNALGSYYLFRILIRDWSDFVGIIRAFIVIGAVLAVAFVIEYSTRRNLFSIFGGVPLITHIREGRLRCQGAYSHPILAGCFWAAVVPLISALWWKSRSERKWVIGGILASLTIVVCSASSTPVMGVIFGMIGGLMFYARRYLRSVRWGILFTLIALHVMMKAPVWNLIARVNVVSGSTGWHRYNLINQAILHVKQWWMMGCSGSIVASWGVYKGDVTNHYILECVQGGILTLTLFVITIGIAFRNVGLMRRYYENDRFRLALSWTLGVSLFVHCMNFLGVSYFGQMYVAWYLTLASIASLTPVRNPVPITRTSTRAVQSRPYSPRTIPSHARV